MKYEIDLNWNLSHNCARVLGVVQNSSISLSEPDSLIWRQTGVSVGEDHTNRKGRTDITNKKLLSY